MVSSNISEAVSLRMSSIRGKNTKIELALRRKLWYEGIRYRLNSTLIGKPDMIFPSRKVVVFVDGDFWHGYQIKDLTKKKFNNKHFWISKIEKNVLRDKAVNKSLSKMGYKVVRFWEHEIINDVEGCYIRMKKVLDK